MKKLLFILPLLVFYLSMASGININVHYCGGKIKDISFFNLKEKDGCCGNKMRSKGCCNDKTAFVKINDTHQSAYLLKAPHATFKIAIDIIPVFEVNISPYWYAIDTFSEIQKPPLLITSCLYIKNSVFLI